jgi:predicted glutamine amidotransferase
MCRIFFIFHHQLELKEIKQIINQRKNKKTNYTLSRRDQGPHMDGMGLAYLLNNNWISRLCPLSPEICTGVLTDLSKTEYTPIIVHLRQHSVKNNCYYKNAFPTLENTHPFLYKDYIFAHNGQLLNFGKNKNLLKFIDKELKPNILGKTDSEQMFYLLLTIYEKARETEINKSKLKSSKKYQYIHENILVPFLKILSNNFEEVLSNIIFSTPEFSIITRYIYIQDNSQKTNINETKPLSLYYSVKNGLIVSSEPIGTGYKLVPEQTVIYVDHKSKHAFLQTIEI